MVELRHLRYFLAVAEELHFARAAARLGIEQSPLSRQIRDLEMDLGVRLFTRTPRSTALTQAGERYVEDARRVLADVETSTRALKIFATGNHPMRLGLAENVAGPAFGRLLVLCQQSDPPIFPVLIERPFADLARMLAANSLDAILAPARVERIDFDCLAAWTEDVVVVMVGENRADQEPIWLKSLANEDWILPDPGALPGCAGQMEGLLSRKGIHRRSASTMACSATLIGLVAAGVGVGLLSVSLGEAPPGIGLRRLKDHDAVLTTWLTVRRDCPAATMDMLRGLIRRAELRPQPPGPE
jgi:DNA-binding transcriptional LysR family regulator